MAPTASFEIYLLRNANAPTVASVYLFTVSSTSSLSSPPPPPPPTSVSCLSSPSTAFISDFQLRRTSAPAKPPSVIEDSVAASHLREFYHLRPTPTIYLRLVLPPITSHQSLPYATTHCHPILCRPTQRKPSMPRSLIRRN